MTIIATAQAILAASNIDFIKVEFMLVSVNFRRMLLSWLHGTAAALMEAGPGYRSLDTVTNLKETKKQAAIVSPTKSALRKGPTTDDMQKALDILKRAGQGNAPMKGDELDG